MDRKTRSKIMSDPPTAKIIMGVLFLGKKSYPTTITNIAFNLSTDNITATPEYTLIRRRLKTLEEQNIIKKISPEKRGEFKTHFQINTDEFLELLLQYIYKDIPLYGGRGRFEKKNHKKQAKNRYIRATLIFFLRGLSVNYLHVTARSIQDKENAEWVNYIENLTLREIIFLFFKKMIRNEIVNASEGIGEPTPPNSHELEGKEYEKKQEEFKKKWEKHEPIMCVIAGEKITYKDAEELQKKDPEKHEFLLFLSYLWFINDLSLISQYLNSMEFDFAEALGKIFFERKPWRDITDLFEDPDKAFTYYPRD
jgi:hypothetical protein